MLVNSLKGVCQFILNYWPIFFLFFVWRIARHIKMMRKAIEAFVLSDIFRGGMYGKKSANPREQGDIDIKPKRGADKGKEG